MEHSWCSMTEPIAVMFLIEAAVCMSSARLLQTLFGCLNSAGAAKFKLFATPDDVVRTQLHMRYR